MVASKLMRDFPVFLYWGLPCLYFYLVVSKANFGWDANDLVWRAGVVTAFFFASLISRRILSSTTRGEKKKHQTALFAFIALPLIIHLLGITIVNGAPGIGAEL